jgi:hypothetical protein
MTSDQLLTEIERQKKYLGRLPKNFPFPLFNARQALESQRKSAYRDTASAAREIIDNAIEAGATIAHVLFESDRSESRKTTVRSVAFVDDGSGMLPEMARYALTWGGGTHFDEPGLIGRFGFGLPNASINQARRIEVYTRTDGASDFWKAWLDLNDFAEFGTQGIPEPVVSLLPKFVEEYLTRNRLRLENGTVVVWVGPDRLTYKTPAPLKQHMVDDFSVAYRYMLRQGEAGPGIELRVENVDVQPTDPLFLTPGARMYVPPEEGGAELVEERLIPVEYFTDKDTGDQRLRRFSEGETIEATQNTLAIGTIQVRIARFPLRFAEDKGKRTQEPTDAHRRFEIRKSRRGISFVRANREIQTVDVFPRTQHDVSSGLGNWPLLQSYAYHWGVEIRFRPELDDVFGITNDKQGVRPIEDFWRVLTESGIDQALHRENRWQADQRRQPPKVEPSPIATPAEQSAYAADVAMGSAPRVPSHRASAARQNLEQEAESRAATGAGSIEEARAALEHEARLRPYRIEFSDNSHAPFYEPDWRGAQIVVRLNRKHPFFRVLYGDLARVHGAAKAKESVDLLLITLAKAELTADIEEMAIWYRAQRERVWSPFLDTAVRSLDQRWPQEEEQSGEELAGNIANDVE